MRNLFRSRKAHVSLEILITAVLMVGANTYATADKHDSSVVQAAQVKKSTTNKAAIASSQQAAAKSSSQATDAQASSSSSSAAAQQTSTQAQPAATVQTQAAVQTRTDGMNFAGQHFDITSFSGIDGQKTPSWTPYIFQWSQISNYYLAEAASQAGTAVKSLKIGSEIVVNGRTLHVTQILPSMDRDSSYDTVASMASQHAIGIQTCVNASGSVVATYWAD